jgi:hypothetical protein
MEDPGRSRSRQSLGLVLFGVLLAAFGLSKMINEGVFEAKKPLDLGGEPALVLFTLSRGCECQMVVVEAAERQLADWSLPAQVGLLIHRVDFERRRDLAKQYGVVRAPALVVLDYTGETAWKQDLALSDEAPLDLEEAARQVELVVKPAQ